jgi:tetratricopeptide (TPR) repeat protein
VRNSGHRLVKKVQQSQQKATAALEKNDYDTAVKHLQTLIDIDPQHNTVVPKARLDLATALKGLKKYKEAKVEAEKVIAANQNDAEAYRVLASIHTELDEFDEAVGRLRKANELRAGMTSLW